MIFIINIIFVKACLVQNEVYNLYPTEGEVIEITMDKLIQGSNLTYECEKCQQGVSVQKIFKNQKEFVNKYSFISVSFHEDKIFALTTEHSINIYDKQIEEIIHNPIVIPIDNNYECFSLTYSELLNLILDCYVNQTLFIFSLQGMQLNQIYTTNSSTPNQTKISTIVKNNQTYIIYGQSFTQFNTTNQNSTILNLSILKEQRRHSSFILTDKLIVNAYNFFVSSRETINQTIFIQYYGNITSYVLQQNGTLLYINNISFVHEIINMAYYYSQDEYYQFDRLFLIVLDDDFDYMYFVNVFYSDAFNVQILESKQQRKAVDREAQVFVNQNFIILYNNQTISILKNQEFNQILFRKKYVYDNNTVIYFDQFKEELFIFSRITKIYQLQVPFLSFVSNQNQGNFSIRAIEIDDYFQIHMCKVKINFLQVSQSDNNIYFVFNSPQVQYYNLLQFPFVYVIGYVSGPLIQAKSRVSYPELGFFQDHTLQKTDQSLQSKKYYKVKAFSITLFQECKSKIFSCIFMVAVSNQYIDVYEEGSKSIVSTINIAYMNINVTQIEITFVVLNQQLFFIICLSFGQNLIQIYYYNATLYLTNNITLSTEPFTQFQLLSDSIVLLQNTNSIALTTFDNKSQILFNQKIFEETSGLNVSFNPINIFINQQYQSRVLYINNINSFIIGYITEHLQFVLISIQNVNFQIEYLLVVNNLLILSWIPQYEEVIYFEVWNVKNLTNPQYLRQMRSISFGLDKQSISYYSDNQFLYVSNNLTLIVQNPNLPSHSSLYYRIPYDGLYFTSIAIDSMAFLFFNQSFFLLSPFLLQSFFNESIHQNFLTEQIFNFTFSSYLNDSNQIQQPNNSLIIINNYLYININNTKVEYWENQSYVELFLQNITFSGQALQFKIIDEQDNNRNYSLTNNIQFSNTRNQSQTYNQIIQYNKSEFLLMNNQTILKYGNISDAQYHFGPYNSCVASTSQNEIIYALCQVNSNYQIISMNISNVQTNNNLYPNIIVSLTNQSFSQNAWLRIQNDQLYIWNDENLNNGIHMYFINQSQQQQGQFICISTQFGFQTHQIQMGDSSIIIYMYFKPIHKDQLYYKFAKIDNQSIFTHGDENSILLESITHQFFSFDTIPMIFRKNKEIILMISNSNFNLIVSFLLVINKQNITNSQIIYQSIIQTSPPYDKHNFNVSQPPQYDSGLLLFMYSNISNRSNQTHMITLYNISYYENFNVDNVSFQTPLLFIGGYLFTLDYALVNDFSFLAENNSIGTILILLNNGSTLEFELNIFSLKIDLTQVTKKDIAIHLQAYNYYNSNSAYINLEFHKMHIFESTSFYVLFGITIIVLVTLFLVYSAYQSSNKDGVDDSEDSDDEL